MKRALFLGIIFLFLTTTCEKKQENEELNLNFSSDSFGCSSFFVYKINETGNVGIAVGGSREGLNLSTDEQSFDLATHADNLHVEMVKSPSLASYYCNDVIIDNRIYGRWVGKEGLIKIKITEDNHDDSPFGEEYYRIDVTIEWVNLENAKGDKISIEHLYFNDVAVGPLPG
jgi:hypothetical protein